MAMIPGRSCLADGLSMSVVMALIVLVQFPGAIMFARAAGMAHTGPGPQPLPPLPVQAPDAAEAALEPARWQASEIADARRACEAIAAKTSARFEILAPRRQGSCGAPAPIRLQSIGADAPIRFVPAPVVTCDVVAGLSQWIEQGLKPLAEKHLESSISDILVMSSYSCRTRYGRAGARMSEHAFANALDIAGFRFSDGREVKVVTDWGATRRDLLAAARSTPAANDPILPPAAIAGPAAIPQSSRTDSETAATLPPAPERRPPGKTVGVDVGAGAAPRRRSARPAPAQAKPPHRADRQAASPAAPGPARDATRFLREGHKIACDIFGTTLGPEANDAHRNHFHVDMFPRRNRGYCE